MCFQGATEALSAIRRAFAPWMGEEGQNPERPKLIWWERRSAARFAGPTDLQGRWGSVGSRGHPMLGRAPFEPQHVGVTQELGESMHPLSTHSFGPLAGFGDPQVVHRLVHKREPHSTRARSALDPLIRVRSSGTTSRSGRRRTGPTKPAARPPRASRSTPGVCHSRASARSRFGPKLAWGDLLL